MHRFLSHVSHFRIERALSVSEWTLVALLLCAYAYFVVMTVTHVVYRQDLMLAIQNTEANISELEAKYLAYERTLSTSAASELGLVALHTAGYVDVGPAAERISQRP